MADWMRLERIAKKITTNTPIGGLMFIAVARCQGDKHMPCWKPRADPKVGLCRFHHETNGHSIYPCMRRCELAVMREIARIAEDTEGM